MKPFSAGPMPLVLHSGSVRSSRRRIAAWAAKGLREVYLFVHSPGELTSPDMMGYLIVKFNERCGAGLRVPQLVNGGQPGNLSLF